MQAMCPDFIVPEQLGFAPVLELSNQGEMASVLAIREPL